MKQEWRAACMRRMCPPERAAACSMPEDDSLINTLYKLKSPRVIEAFYEDLAPRETDILVRPEKLSICKADLRYFYGMRDANILKQKLPLTLIHEAAGRVLIDPAGRFRKGDRVVLLPNIPGTDTRAEENYRRDSRFRSSSADGFMQELVALPESQLVRYESIPADIAAFTEFISVGVHAVTTYRNRCRNLPRRIGVWGDGSLGYSIASILKYYLPDVTVAVIGVQRSKLELFQFADEIYTIDEVDPETVWFDDVFECVGGQPSADAIAQMIDVIRPEGTMMLLGVSETPVAVNTRMVLEKGLTLIGRSRSGRDSFQEAVRILETDARFARRMKPLISEVVDIQKIGDIHRAFAAAHGADFKVVMNWDI